MRHIVRLYLTVIACFMAALGAIRSLGGAQGDPISALFTNPDGSACNMPCLFGVRPGATTMGDALNILHVHPLTKNLRQQVLQDQGSKGEIRLRAQGMALEITPETPSTAQSTRVTNVMMWVADNSDLTFRPPRADQLLSSALTTATTGGLYLHFGPPVEVRFGFGGTATFPTSVSMIYPEKGLTVVTWLKEDLYSQHSKVDEKGGFLALIVYAGRDAREDGSSIPWFGFISPKGYIEKLCRLQPGAVVCDGD